MYVDIELQSIQQRKVVEEIQKDLLLKANIKDVCTLLDTKSSNITIFVYWNLNGY